MAQKEKWSHLSIGQRKTIAHLIAVGKKAKEIGEALGVSPTTVSREIKRNRAKIGPGDAGL